MATLTELHKAKSANYESARAIIDAAGRAGRGLTVVEQQTVNGLENNMRRISAEIEKVVSASGGGTRTSAAPSRTPGRIATPAAPSRPRPSTPSAPGTPARTTPLWNSLGEQLLAVRAAALGHPLDPRLQSRAASGANELLGSEGGYLVAEGFATDLLQRAFLSGVVAQRCTGFNVRRGNGLDLPAFAETSRATGSRFGGVRGYWADEADAATASKPAFRRVSLRLNKLIGLVYATEELTEDAEAFGDALAIGFAGEFGFLLDLAVTFGTGAGQPQGVMNSGALITVAKEVGQAAGSIVPANITKMWARLWVAARANAAWFMSETAERRLYELDWSGAPGIFTPAGVAGSRFALLYGAPVIAIEQCQPLGTTGDIILGDFSRYVIAQRPLEMAESMHVRFDVGEDVFRFILRVDGQTMENAPLTPFRGGDTVSSFVALETRA